MSRTILDLIRSTAIDAAREAAYEAADKAIAEAETKNVPFRTPAVWADIDLRDGEWDDVLDALTRVAPVLAADVARAWAEGTLIALLNKAYEERLGY